MTMLCSRPYVWNDAHLAQGLVEKDERGTVFMERNSYLVDPASSHMLVSKIKPCMCKYEQIQTVKLRMAH